MFCLVTDSHFLFPGVTAPVNKENRVKRGAQVITTKCFLFGYQAWYQVILFYHDFFRFRNFVLGLPFQLFRSFCKLMPLLDFFHCYTYAYGMFYTPKWFIGNLPITKVCWHGWSCIQCLVKFVYLHVYECCQLLCSHCMIVEVGVGMYRKRKGDEVILRSAEKSKIWWVVRCRRPLWLWMEFSHDWNEILNSQKWTAQNEKSGKDRKIP